MCAIVYACDIHMANVNKNIENGLQKVGINYKFWV